jgi:hypothetical protein
MASLVTSTVDDPKAGEMWTKKNPEAEDDPLNTVYIEYIQGGNVIYKDLVNTEGAYETPIVEFLRLYSKDELDLDGFEFKSSSNDDDFPNDDYIGFDELVDPDNMIIDSDNNNNDDRKFSDDSSSNEDSSNDDDDSSDKKLPTITLKKKKGPPKTVKTTTIKLKRGPKKSPTTSEPTIKRMRMRKPKKYRGGKYDRKGKNPYTRTETKYIKWTFSMNDDTLFYPIYKDQVVPQVMTITKVEKKRYIFELKDDDNGKIRRWSEWRRDFNSVNSWVQQIGRIIYKCKNDNERNFLKALQRSFTITKKVYRTNENYPTFKIEMAVCYVHFIKNKGTDHTWPTFREYFLKDTTNCGALKAIFNTITREKETKNRENNEKVPTRGITKFASNAFLESLEYVTDRSFKVLNTREKQQAKETLKAIIGTIVGKRVAQNATLLMAKLKF